MLILQKHSVLFFLKTHQFVMVHQLPLTVDTFLTTSILWSTGDSTNSIVVAPTQTTTVWVEQVFNGRTCYDSVTITVFPEINITANITNPSSPILVMEILPHSYWRWRWLYLPWNTLEQF